MMNKLTIEQIKKLIDFAVINYEYTIVAELYETLAEKYREKQTEYNMNIVKESFK